MAIYRREHLEPYLCELENYYQALRRAVAGHPPNDNLAPHYHANPDQFKRDYREVDLKRVKYQIAHFKAAVDFVKELKDEAATMIGK